MWQLIDAICSYSCHFKGFPDWKNGFSCLHTNVNWISHIQATENLLARLSFFFSHSFFLTLCFSYSFWGRTPQQKKEKLANEVPFISAFQEQRELVSPYMEIIRGPIFSPVAAKGSSFFLTFILCWKKKGNIYFLFLSTWTFFVSSFSSPRLSFYRKYVNVQMDGLGK